MMIVRRYALAVLLFTLLATIPVGADEGREIVVLDPEAGDSQPALAVLSRNENSLALMFRLPALQRQHLEVDGQPYQTLTIPGGGMTGEEGEPGLPIYQALVAIPAGVTVDVGVISREVQKLEPARILPVQPDAADQFVINPEAYTSKGKPASPTVVAGKPGQIRGLRVVPITIHPLDYEPGSGDLTVSHHLEVKLEFRTAGKAPRNDTSSRPLPESFARIYEERILGYKASAPAVAPGAYLVICRQDLEVTARLQPLLEWRRRQGYHTSLVSVAASATAASIKQILQDSYDNGPVPLEYVTIVGDAAGSPSYSVPCWYETRSGYHGEGDHYYTLLEGDDILADVHIGRLSFSTLSELDSIIDKIITYETDPPAGDPGWFTRAGLASDSSQSGITTVYVNQWLKAQLMAQGYTQVDTVWSGSFLSTMTSFINQGITAFGYRGFHNMSGMTPDHIYYLNNGYELPFAVLPTCGTGSFASYTRCHSEAFLRAPNGGAVAAVATATLGTHTRYNNCYYQGIWNGMVNSGDHHVGVAHTLGKLELYNCYQIAEPHNAEIWSVWNNVMGDPATEIWTALPLDLTVEHAALLPVGANAVPVRVLVAGIPLAGARVSLSTASATLASDCTDTEGRVTLPLSGMSAGAVRVTVTCHNHRPYLGSTTLGPVAAFAALEQTTIDDDALAPSSGNGDGIANPGEIIALGVSLRNLGSETITSAMATLSSADSAVTVLSASVAYGALAPGAAVAGAGEFVILIDPAAQDGHVLPLQIEVTGAGQSWTSVLEIPVESAAFTLESWTWTGGGQTLDPGEAGNLIVTLRNTGSITATSVSAQLSSDSPWIDIVPSSSGFGDMPPGAVRENSLVPYVIEVDAGCFPGHLAGFTLTLHFNDIVTVCVEFAWPVGTATSDDPLGPDAHGYYAFDNTDTDYPFAPNYDWVEIDPNHGGGGVSVGLHDFGWEQDDTRTLDLPFSFRYYGQEYDQISVCSNGWIAMGTTTLRHYRNYSIPCAGSPRSMIAAFWDNLYQTGGNQVYYWHDTDNHRFIIQWSRLRNHYSDAVQNFEVILYHPVLYPTVTGDGPIVLQYETVNNTDVVNGYASVGIQNQDRTDGLLYGYWNETAPAGAPLAGGRAIRFVPIGENLAATCEVDPATLSLQMLPDHQETTWLNIHNGGQPGSLLHYIIETRDPDYPRKAPGAVPRDIGGSYLVADTAEYLPLAPMDVTFTTFVHSSDAEPVVRVQLSFPADVVVNSGTDMVGDMGHMLPYNGATGAGVYAIWGDSGGSFTDGEQASATMNLTFNDVIGDMEVGYVIFGNESGGTPHRVYGSVIFTSSGAAVRVASPDGGEAWAVGETRDIEFLAAAGPEAVMIELQRALDGPWETLAADVPVAEGRYAWTVTAPTSAHCRIRISDMADPLIFDVSDAEFTIYRALNWLTLDHESGTVPEGESATVEVAFDTSGLPEDTYAAEIHIINSSGEPVVVPVSLTVSSDVTFVPGDLPAAVGLGRNRPNPFNPRTSISFALSRDGHARLEIFDLHGERVVTLLDRSLPAGSHQVIWDGRNTAGQTVATGVYLYRLQAEGKILSEKMTLLK